jgi:hypothetical protein
MPRVGIYARYNAMGFDWAGILHGYERLIPDILQTTVFVPLSIPFVSWAAGLVFVTVVLASKPVSEHLQMEATKSLLITMAGLGFLALLGTALPYYVVGRRSFQAFGFMSRDNVLFPLAVGWITAALIGMLWNSGDRLRRVALGACAALIFAQSVSNWRNHADWQAHYAYTRSAIEKIAQDRTVEQASVIQVIDHIPGDRTLQTRKYPTSIWTGIISAAFQRTARLAIPFPPENGRFYSRDEFNRRVRETEVAFMLGGIDLDGQQIRLTVEPGNGPRGPLRLALAYWRARFFDPAQMPMLLDSLTRVRSERIISAQ